MGFPWIQVVTEYDVTARVAGQTAPVPFVSGTTVGHKHINIRSAPLDNVTSLVLQIKSSVAAPTVKMSVFDPAGCSGSSKKQPVLVGVCSLSPCRGMWLWLWC